MQVYVLDKNYEKLGMIDEAESVLWLKKYNDIGESEIYIPCNSEYLDLLKRGNYIYRYDDDMVCKILKRDIDTDVEDGDYIIVPAKDLCVILAGRIVRWQVVYSGTVAGFIERLLTENVISPKQGHRRINGFRFIADTSNGEAFTERIETTAQGEDLLQLIISTCKLYKYGFRVTYDIEAREIIFRLYKGKNKSFIDAEEYVEFSPSFANILSSHYSEDESDLKNVVYVSYKAADESVHYLSYPDDEQSITGEKRREIFVDGTGVSRDITYDELQQMYPSVAKATSTGADGKVTSTYTSGGQVVATSEGSGDEEKITVSDNTYIKLVRALAADTLSAHTEKTEFSGSIDTIDTYQYKIDYDLGDVVYVVNEHGIGSPARIADVMESDDGDDGHVVEPTFEFEGTEG